MPKFVQVVLLLLLSVALSSCSPVQPVSFPVHKSIEGSTVSIEIQLIDLKTGPEGKAWCYRTRGLKPHDLVMTVLQKRGEQDQDFPTQPIQALSVLVTADREPLSPGDLVDVAGFENPALTGVLAVKEGPGLPDSASCLSIIPITKDELAAARLSGSSRLMGLLASQSRYYPCPYWYDRDRSSACNADDVAVMTSSPTQAGVQYRGDVSLMVTDGVGSLSMTRATGKALSEAMVAGEQPILRVALNIDPRANAFMVWDSAGKEPAAVGPDGSNASRVSYQFLQIIGGQEKNQSLRRYDGISLILSESSYRKLAKAAGAGQDFSLESEGDGFKSLRLVWQETDYFNPADQSIYRTDSGWVTHTPETKTPPKSGKVKLEEVVLLTPESELLQAITQEDLIGYIKAIEQVVITKGEASQLKQDLELALDCVLSGAEPANLKVAYSPKFPEAKKLASDVDAGLKKVSVPKVKGKVKFTLRFSVKTGK